MRVAYALYFWYTDARAHRDFSLARLTTVDREERGDVVRDDERVIVVESDARVVSLTEESRTVQVPSAMRTAETVE